MSFNKVCWKDVTEGQDIGSYTTELTKVKIIGGAMIATRDTNPIHHDTGFAQTVAMQRDVILNIMHTEALLCKLATDWSGPTGDLKRCQFRIHGAGCPNDMLTVSGTVVRKWIGGEEEEYLAGLHLAELAIKADIQDGPNSSAKIIIALPE